MARLLAPEDFGLVAMATVVIGFANLLADFGLGSATVQRADLDDNIVSALFYVQLGIAGLLMLVVMATAPLIAVAFSDERVTSLVLILAPTLPVLAASSQHVALLQREMHWCKMQGVGIVAQAVGTVTAISLSLATDIGYWALVAQGWLVAVTTCLLAWLWSPWLPGLVKSWTQAVPAIKFGFGLTGYNMINSLHRQFDNMIVGAAAGAEQLGYYTRAYGLLMIPQTAFVKPFFTAVYPALSRLQSDPARWRQMFLSSVTSITCLAAPLSGILILTANFIIPLLYGDQWFASVPIFQILAISMLIQPVYNAAGWISFSLGKSRRMIGAAVVSTGIYCIAFAIGVRYQAIGVAAAYTAAVFLLTPMWLWWSSRGTILTVVDILGASAPPIISALVAGALAFLLFPLNDSIVGELFRAFGFGVFYAINLAICWRALPKWRAHVDPVIDRIRQLFRSIRKKYF